MKKSLVALGLVAVVGCAADRSDSVAKQQAAVETASSPRAILCKTGAFADPIGVVPAPTPDGIRFPTSSKEAHKARVLAAGGLPRPKPAGTIHLNMATFQAEDARLKALYGSDDAGYSTARARAKLNLLSN